MRQTPDSWWDETILDGNAGLSGLQEVKGDDNEKVVLYYDEDQLEDGELVQHGEEVVTSE